LPKFTQIVFELGENVAMVLFIGYYCNFLLQKCCQLRWNYLGMLTIMIPLQNWKIKKICKDRKESRFLGIRDHLRRILMIFGFLRTSLVQRISLDGTLIFIKWNSSSHRYICYGPKSMKGFPLPLPTWGSSKGRSLKYCFQ